MAPHAQRADNQNELTQVRMAPDSVDKCGAPLEINDLVAN